MLRGSWLILSAVLFSAGIAKADFSGDYVITNWTQTTSNATIDTTNTPASVTLNLNGGGGSRTASLNYASLPRSGSLAFEYSITVTGNGTHIGSYSLNGVSSAFVIGTAANSPASGSVTVAGLRAGQPFQVSLVKTGGTGASSMTITGFTFSESVPTSTSVPTLSEWALVLFGLLMVGVVVWRQHPGLRNARK